MIENPRLDAILLCGGKGERLYELTDDLLPKSLFPFQNKELIQYSLDLIDLSVVNNLIFAVDYKAEQMEKWIENLNLIDQLITISSQGEPDVLGALSGALHHTLEELVVSCNTDEIRIGFEMSNLIEAHYNSGCLATVVGIYTNNLARHRVLQIDEESKLVRNSLLKPDEYRDKPEVKGLVNSGFLLINQRAFEFADSEHSTGWSGLIDPLVEAGQLNVYVVEKGIYFNIGTPEEFREANDYFSERLVPEPVMK